MKKYLLILAGFTLVLFLLAVLPARLAGGGARLRSTAVATETTTLSSADDNPSNTPASDEYCTSYTMLDITSGKTVEISVRDYLIGAVCAEMPATFAPEALKAQAVAAHTYAERQHQLEQQNPTPELNGADFSNDSTRYQACFTENQARLYYGDSFELYYQKITDAVDAVLPYILTYDGDPIIAAFCSMSSGTTESAETVWGTQVAYLVPVESAADMEAPRYLDTKTFSAEQLRTALEETFPDITLGDDPTAWIVPGQRSDAGTVCSVTVGDMTCTGQTLRQALDLRSADFSFEWDGTNCCFTTKGYGHGVGMSQYGANAMAQDGGSWEEILAHYYPNTQLVQAAGLKST